MGDLAAAAEGNGATPESVPSIDDIVEANWQDGATSDAVPAPVAQSGGEPEKATGAVTVEPPAAPTATEKPLYTAEELRKLTAREIESPTFDWNRVPPEAASYLKAGQALLTKQRQELADQKRALESEKSKPATTTPAVEDDPVEKENQEIVDRALRAKGIDPEALREVAEDRIYSSAVALVADSVPDYVTDQNFNAAANKVIATDPKLYALSQSKDPEKIATAIEVASLRVQKQLFLSRTAELTEKQKLLDQQLAEVTKHKTDLSRQPASIAAGGSPAAPARPASSSMRDIVDEEWPAGTGSLLG